jgi:transmembrane sensor
LRVDFLPRSRHIDLLEGEAHFHVQKDVTRPFVVDTRHARVRALGTTFNVRVAARDTDVTLLEGRVAVSKHIAEEVKAGGTLELKAGQNVRVQSSGAMAFGQGRTAHDANAWPQLRIAFQGSKLKDVVAEVNRHQDHPFVINDAMLNEMIVTGSLNVFESESFWNSLDYLSVERREDGTTLLTPAGNRLHDR